ncbi:MAG: hypothetical protein LBF72_00195 [Holosporales bacterium]|jgi:membrane protein implicated in regulation of membrane protease activity|nr:hypothetical protein [Holosporales bacterium]
MLDFLGEGYFAKACFVIAVSSTLLFLLKLVFFSFFGGGADFDSEVDAAGSDDAMQHNSSFTFISLQSILVFLMGFGWIGLAGVLEWKLGSITAFLVAFMVGIVFMALSVWLMFQVKKLSRVRENSINDALSKMGRAYTRFSSNGPGQIQIELHGHLSTVNAMNYRNEEILAFDAVQVVAIKDGVLYVQKV